MLLLSTIEFIFRELFDNLVPIGICCVLPILIVSMTLKSNKNKFNRRMDIVKMAIEKDSTLDLEQLIEKISPRKKTYAEKSVSMLLVSFILNFLGIGAVILSQVFRSKGVEDGHYIFLIGACVLLGVGLSFLVSYFAAQRLIKKGLVK